MTQAAPRSMAAEATDEEWREGFGHLVDPLPRLQREVPLDRLGVGAGGRDVRGLPPQ